MFPNMHYILINKHDILRNHPVFRLVPEMTNVDIFIGVLYVFVLWPLVFLISLFD